MASKNRLRNLASILAAALVVSSAGAEILSLSSPSEIPSNVVQQADDFRPDIKGFLMRQKKPQPQPPSSTLNRTKVDFDALTTSYDSTPKNNVDTSYVDTQADFPVNITRTIYNYWVRPDGTVRWSNRFQETQADNVNTPNGTATFDLHQLLSYELSGQSAFVPNDPSHGGQHSDTYHGVTLRDETGNIAFLREDEHHITDYAASGPVPPEIVGHVTLWKSTTVQKPYDDTPLPAAFAAGMTDASPGYPIMVFIAGTSLTKVTFTPNFPTEITVNGFTAPAGMNLLACAEKGSELVVVYSLNSELRVFSNTYRGDRSLGALACTDTTPVYTWFDATNAVHILVGDLETQTGTCGAHYWRAPTVQSPWSTFAFATGATISDIWFDMGELEHLKGLFAGEQNGTPFVNYSQFESGTWTTTTIATGSAGQHFDRISTGTIGDGSKIAIFRRTSDAAPNDSHWFFTKSGVDDIVPVLLGTTSYQSADDRNSDGIGDAADAELKPGKRKKQR